MRIGERASFTSISSIRELTHGSSRNQDLAETNRVAVIGNVRGNCVIVHQNFLTILRVARREMAYEYLVVCLRAQCLGCRGAEN